MKLDELKHILGFEPGQYSRWGNFKTRILEVARKELKKYSDLYFEYETEKKRRVVHSITFTILKQRQKRLFDNEDFIRNDEPMASYHKSADETIRKFQEAAVDTVPMPKGLKAKNRKD